MLESNLITGLESTMNTGKRYLKWVLVLDQVALA